MHLNQLTISKKGVLNEMDLSLDAKIELLNEKVMMLKKADIKASSLVINEEEESAYFLTRLILNDMMIPEIVSIGIDDNNDFIVDEEVIERDYLAHLITTTSNYYSSPLQRGLINFSRSAIYATQLLLEYDEENSSDEQKEELSEILYDCDRTRQYIYRHTFGSHIDAEIRNELKILDPSLNIEKDYHSISREDTAFTKTLKSVINNSK